MQQPESESISFDRAVSFYDQTRGLPPGVAEEIAASLLFHLPDLAQILEIGIGTGRIAKPFLQRGLRVAGIDLSARMMGRLLETLPSATSHPLLAQADAARLPLAADRFDAVIGVHVFHLIAGWQEALLEVHRVLRTGGSLLVGYDDRPGPTEHERTAAQWVRLVTARYPQYSRPGIQELDALKKALLASGASLEEWVAAEWTTEGHIGRYIDFLEQRIFSSTWQIPDEVLQPAIAELRQWALQEFGSLDKPLPMQRVFIWQRYRWP
ncbi:MAG TPA: class I SAM-dependent methyltransferase [Anaerolineales bacterium]